MCDTCGCNLTPGVSAPADSPRHHHEVEVLRGVLSRNDALAVHNREHLGRHRVLAVNLMSSPGAGKTALLEATIAALGGEFSLAVIEGDLETENDAQRIRAAGVPAVQITTGSACHLDAGMVHHALHDLPLDGVDILFIENVGNLVCPASFDLGQHRNVVLLSTPEGEDKPAKYPVMFRAADLVLLTKSDFLPLMPEVRPPEVERHLRHLASRAPLFTLSARTGEGLAAWLNWLRAELTRVRADATPAEETAP